MLTGEAVELDRSPSLPEPLHTLPRWSRPPLEGSARPLVHLKRRLRGRGGFPAGGGPDHWPIPRRGRVPGAS